LFDKKIQVIKDRSGMNIKSGRVMMDVKDRDWLFATVENLSMRSKAEHEFYKKTIELFDEYFPEWRSQ
jgi:hypothetical protein